MDKFPKVEVLPLVDRVVSAGLWVGRLLTQHVQHLTPSEHFTSSPWMDTGTLKTEADIDALFNTPDHTDAPLEQYKY